MGNPHTSFILNKAVQALQTAAPKTSKAGWSQSRSHSTLSSYQDRVCLAHMAMMTFGLVALLGAWPDPVQGLCLATSLCALMIFSALLLIGSQFPFAALRFSRSLVVARTSRVREGIAAERFLRWYSAANHLNLPPPHKFGSYLEATLNNAPSRSVLPLFCFPSVLCVSFYFGGVNVNFSF